MDLSNTAKNQALKPTVSTNNTVVPIRPETVPRLLTDVFFAPLRVILETADIARPCHSLDDLTFALLGVWRALQASANGRDFLQTQALPLVPELTRGNYFAALSSPQQLALLPDLARHRLNIVSFLRKTTATKQAMRISAELGLVWYDILPWDEIGRSQDSRIMGFLHSATTHAQDSKEFPQ